MVPTSRIQEWRKYAPWMNQSQIEQDLVLSRALVELYNNDLIRNSLALKGGTALNKLFIRTSRYSEDIDLVRLDKGPAGPIFAAIKNVLDLWLGKPEWKQTPKSVKLIYHFKSEDSFPLRLKIEINIVEIFTIYGYDFQEYSVQNHWFNGTASIRTFQLEELMGTKLKALYQRMKGRDLFDLWLALTQPDIDCDKIMNSFFHYGKADNVKITRALFERNLVSKIRSHEFIGDIRPLLKASDQNWDLMNAYTTVMDKLVSRVPGRPYKNLQF